MKTTAMRWFRAAGLGASWSLAAACGGSAVDMTVADGGRDGERGSDDATIDATARPPEPGSGASDGASDAGTQADADAGSPCAAPANPGKAALCISFTHDALAFLAADPSFDGKGLLAVDVHDTANPDAPDGGSLPALTGAVFPSGDAGEVDLASPLPAVRFDDLPPGVVYPRAIFVDSRDTQKVGAGWWLGGYDLAGGLHTPALLRPVTLPAGVGTAVTIDLTALRALGVTLTRSAAPAGNGQGPATVIVTPSAAPTDASTFFGLATNPCANLAAADAAVRAQGFVFGAGPYYAVGLLDDVAADAAPGLSPGALTSLSFVDGSLASPASAVVQYAPGAYVVQTTLDLDLAVPLGDAGLDGGDPVTCP